MPGLARHVGKGEPINGKVLLLWQSKAMATPYSFAAMPSCWRRGARVWLVCAGLVAGLAQGAPALSGCCRQSTAAAEAGQVGF